MKQILTGPGDRFHSVANRAIKEAPSWFDFNGVRVTVIEEMKLRPAEAAEHLWAYYQAVTNGDPLPLWKETKAKEKPCKQCGRNNFVTDKKCWWCEQSNPCTSG